MGKTVLDEISVTSTDFFDGITTDKSKMPQNLNLLIDNSHGKSFILNGKEFTLTKQSKYQKISEMLAKKCSHICQVVYSNRDGSFRAKLIVFSGSDIVLGINGDEAISILYDKNNKIKDSKQLEEESLIDLKGNKYFIIQSSSDEVSFDVAQTEGFSFSIITKEKNIDVKTVRNGEKSYYEVLHVYRRRNNKRNSNFHLVRGSFKISDSKTFIQGIVKNQIDKLRDAKGSYLDDWKSYTKERAEKIIRDAVSFGKYNVLNVEKTQNGYRLFFTMPIEFKRREISVYHKEYPEPLFLSKENCTFDEVMLAKNETKRKVRAKNAEIEDWKKQIAFIDGEIIWQKENCIEILVEENDRFFSAEYFKDGYITLSTTAEEIQITRQQRAWEKVTTGNCGITNLGLLIEDGADVGIKAQKRHGKNLSARTLEKIFEYPPTEKQKEAVKIALETPDIALIQGPPGTGKTTVITAIVETLNEMEDKDSNCSGKIHLTSFQHDAVINIIKKLSINSLPTPKYGAKKYVGEYKANIESWKEEIVNRIHQFNLDLTMQDPDYIKFSDCYFNYITEPSSSNEEKFVDSILNATCISGEIKDKAIEILNIEKEDSISAKTRQCLLPQVRALRINPISFMDDGNDRAMDLYEAIESCKDLDASLKKESLSLLEKACLYNQKEDVTQDDKDFYNNLALLKKKLLKVVTPKPTYVKYQKNENLINLYPDVKKCFEKNLSSKDKVTNIISDWVQYIEFNPNALDGTINDLSIAYASTAQQTESKSMSFAKGGDVNFDNVIIDEAARSGPPDLLIPMSNAIKRIILVGDHRQLPQLVDKEICDILEKNQEVKDVDKLANLSLFEKLYYRMKELEKQDGIKRTVTLDEQFRTHPVLGDFASKEFYEIPSGGKESYGSPLPVEKFKHNLSDFTKETENGKIPCCAVWLNVPYSYGKEEKRNSSFIRKCECEVILSTIKKLSESETGKKLSYGVIAFYKEQVELLKKEAKRMNIQLSENQFQIGSVDAFQGMEFDVVFLSVVRCNREGNFGFVSSVNRLCVSMTRQKKVLVVCADKDFCTSDKARKPGLKGIKAIADFYDLCRTSEYGVVL